ncbi:10873_t:CDS:2 [Ambispora gerdemannii]|uniref:10873_t:CDS:1 n=1 Tax=Ambispora gerdemannii TaxID=144530 RepID=A0A9N9FY10_9GLOM|nr:10873_t:CDS:2 [Ambispora gerdemannii]
MKEKQVLYVEDTTFTLPCIKNVVLGLGDLWNCHDSKYSGFNLFAKKFTKDHLIFHPIKNLDYRLIHIKSFQDKLSTIKVDGAISIEFLSGIIEVEGTGEYNVSSGKSANEEKLICQYHLDNYSIELLPCSKDIMDESVKNQLLNNQIKATHVVHSIIIGAEVKADIRIRQIDTARDKTIEGNFFGNIPCGYVNASLKASLELLDAMKVSNFEKRITLHSKPQMHQQPSTINQMFELIEKVDTQVSKEQHFKFLDPDITGVPHRFVLVPITQFLDIKVEKLYKQLNDNTISNFRTMLVTLEDFRTPEYVKRYVLENENRLQVILSDPQSKLSKEILAYEKELKTTSNHYFERAYETLQTYKLAESNSEQLLQIVHDFDKCEYSAMNVYSNIETFVSMGKRELIDVRENDAIIMKAKISFFPSLDVLDRWIYPESNIKILLYTKGNSPDGAFRRLFNISNALQKLGIEIGVALPSISDDFSLVIKIYERKEIYSSNEIPRILGIISAAVETNTSIENRFYALKASLSRVRLPLQPENISDLINLVSILRKDDNVYVAHSYMETLERIRCVHCEDTQWKFFISLDALDTALDAIKNINVYDVFPECEWVVGNSGVQNLYAAPLLFVFHQGEVKAVCLDNLDFLILTQLFEANADPDLSVLSPDSLCYSFYPDRARFAVEVIKIVNQFKDHKLDSANLGIPLFDQVPDQSLTDALDIVRGALSTKDLDIISSVACIVARNHNDLIDLLTEHGWCRTESKFGIRASRTESWESLCIGLEKWLKSKNPFLAKVESAKKTIEQVHINIAAENSKEIFMQAIDSISIDPQCPVNTRTSIENWKESDFKLQCSEMINLLNELSINLAKEHFFHVLEMASLLKQLYQPSSYEFSTNVFKNIIQKYIKRLPFNQEPFKSCQQKITELISFLPELVSQLGDEQFKNEYYEKLWLNSRFIYLIRKSPITIPRVASLLQKSNITACPSYVPQDIQEHLNEYRNKIFEHDNITMPKILNNIDEAIKFFKLMVNRKEIHAPVEFRSLIDNSLSKNAELEKSFESADALIYWNKEKKHLNELWDTQTINDALQKLVQWKRNLDTEPTKTANFNLVFESNDTNFNVHDKQVNADKSWNQIMGKTISKMSTVTSITSKFNLFESSDKNSSEYDKKVLNVHESWNQIMGEKISMIGTKDYVKVCVIIPTPKIDATQQITCVNQVLPYLMQKVKMWGCYALTANNISALMMVERKNINIKSGPFGKSVRTTPPFGQKSNNRPPLASNTLQSKKNSLARIDCIVGLLTSANCIVAQDILRIMAKFPMALPLVIPDMEHENEYKLMLPLLTGPIIKWESKPGTIVENHLFRSPFRLLVAVRLGENQKAPGKSSILNQLMATEHMFSSSGEPGASRGKPHTLSGSVELTWFIQETCSAGLWKSVMQPYYENGTTEIVLLANLHGDALKYSEQVRWLQQFASCFLVFIMPDCKEEKWDQFTEILCSEKLVYAMVDPVDTESDNIIIETRDLMKDETLGKVRLMIQEALKFDSTKINLEKITTGKSLRLAEGIDCAESQRVIDFVRNKTCLNTKQIMQLQKRLTNQDGFELWKNNADLQKLIKLFGIVLHLPLEKKGKAMAHLDRDLYQISSEESSKARKEVILLKEELWRKTGLSKKNLSQERFIKDEIKKALDKVDSMSLGLEHFFRELGQIYEIALTNPSQTNQSVLDFPELYAELLINGHAIELLDGDAGNMSGAWLAAICNKVTKRFPKLRVFIISILGLQSSGKSTLLNALFACKFAVSVGRCTRGLFMRLVFLEKKLYDELNVDAILLIDTEGLGAPEKVNDPEAERKDRLLATFAMGVSNLTLINVLGEYMRDLTEILQIAIVAMARLEKAEMAPDIFMVQHLTERDTGKTVGGVDQFCKALQNALEIADKKDVEMGIANSKCLKNLSDRIQKGELLKQFHPFKNGASAYAPPSEQYHEDITKLYKDILDACKHSHNKIEFKQWHKLVQSYWESVSHEQFAVQFKNVKEMYEFIERGERITKVKEKIDLAFRVHAEQSSMNIRLKIENWLEKNNQDGLRNACETSILENLNIPNNCPIHDCQECEKARSEWNSLKNYVEGKDSKTDTLNTINHYVIHTRESTKITLMQMFDAILMSKGCTTEFMNVITCRLKEELEKQPASKFNETQRKTIADEIWKSLQELARSKENVLPVKRKISKELEIEYENVADFCRRFQDNKIPQTLNVENKKDIIKYYFSSGKKYEREISMLEETLSVLGRVMLREKNRDHFETGMVRELKNKINETITNKFKRNVKDLPFSIWDAHLFALGKFHEEMEKAQKKWDEKNNPIVILEQRQHEYKTLINHRLLYGFSFASEGTIIANCLLQAIKLKAVNAGNYEKKYAVLNLSWTTNSEQVRLKYFEKLAEEVQNGETANAIAHFKRPNHQIDKWFKQIIDEYPNQAQGKYEEIFETESEHVITSVRKYQNIEEIKNFVKHYLAQVGGVEYEMGQDTSEMTESDLDMLRDTMMRSLEAQRNTVQFSPVLFQKLSDDDDVMKRLGCTTHCYWCGALCWGGRAHNENMDDTRRHHTCHQPSGLRGTKDKNTEHLLAMPCHKTLDDTMVYFGDNQNGMKWSDAKSKHFDDWIFATHADTQFNSLMCWFFEKLHKKLANEYNDCKPALQEDLQENNCMNLDYQKIMSKLKLDLGNSNN